MEIEGKIIGAIGIVVITIILLSMTSVVIDQVEGVVGGSGSSNASLWNFTGASGAESILGLVPVCVDCIHSGGRSGWHVCDRQIDLNGKFTIAKRCNNEKTIPKLNSLLFFNVN